MKVDASAFDPVETGPHEVPDEAERLRREVARLTRENRAYARELDLLRAAAQTAVDELDTNVLAQAVARLATQVVSAERASVCVLEYDAVIAQAQHSSVELNPNLVYRYPAQLPQGPGFGLAPRVVAAGQSMVCHDARIDPNLGFEFATKYQVRNAACVPVMNHQSSVLAFIEVFNRRGGGLFTQDDVRRLETLALEASLGFQRSRLLDRLADWSRSLEMLLAFSAAVNQHLDPMQLIRKLVENAALFLKADGGMAGLTVQSADGAKEMVCDGVWSRNRWYESERRWKRHHGLAGFVMENEFPYLSNNYPEEPLADPELVRDFEIKQALCVPIKDPVDVVIGFFELHRSTPHTPFTWQDAAFLESLANVTAVSIRNAQLLKAVEVKNQEIRALSANHVNRLEEERRHISRELHDEAGQILIGIKLALQVTAREIPDERTDLRRDLDDLREQVNQATQRLKDLARWLRPPTLDQLGLEIALRQLATDLQGKGGVSIQLELDSPETRLPQSWEIALYRIAQEALTNVLRHSQALKATVELHCEPGQVRVSVRDNGRGFVEAEAGRGLGLLGMRERAGMLGGVLTIDSAPNRGTLIQVEVPRP